MSGFRRVIRALRLEAERKAKARPAVMCRSCRWTGRRRWDSDRLCECESTCGHAGGFGACPKCSGRLRPTAEVRSDIADSEAMDRVLAGGEP